MGASPQNDPVTRELTELMGEYCRVLSMGEAPFHREEAEYLYKRDDEFTAFDLAPPNTGYHGWAAYAEAWYKIMNKYAHFEMRLYDDVRPLVAAADCVVLPSYREGVPRTLMEASAMGRPIVATDVPGCREVVEHGVNGLLCEVKNADSLTGALERMLTLPFDERAAMAQRGREKVAHEFDEKNVVERYKGTIHAITGISL